MVDCRSQFGRAKAEKVRGKMLWQPGGLVGNRQDLVFLDKAKQGGLPRSATYENVLLSKVDG